MKRILALVVAASALFIGGCSTSAGAVQTLDPQAFLQMASRSGTTTVDVRTPLEYQSGHLSDAVNIDVEGPGFSSTIARMDKSGTYLVYCHSGRRSTLAADAMEQAGFLHVYNLHGGFTDLQAAAATTSSSPLALH
ncbi:MAG: rhodanese-like domain-containing protein [Candidatus Nanopelagicales bacterium]